MLVDVLSLNVISAVGIADLIRWGTAENARGDLWHKTDGAMLVKKEDLFV